MAHVCIGDRAEAALMGYRDPIVGRVETVTRGISVSNAAPSTQGLPSVDPVYTWVRLAQRVPVHIRITNVPPGVPLVSGMTTTVTIRRDEAPASTAWLGYRLARLVTLLDDIVYGPQPSPDCVPRIGDESGATVILPTPKPVAPLDPEQLTPGLAPGIDESPRCRCRLIPTMPFRNKQPIAHGRVSYFRPRGVAGSRHRWADLRPRIVAQSTHTGTSAMARPGQDTPARTIQRVHRRGFEIPYPVAPERQAEPACAHRALCQDQQNADHVLAQRRGQCRSDRPSHHDTYLAPNKTFPELRDMLNDGSIDLLRNFSDACRAEFESLQAAAP